MVIVFFVPDIPGDLEVSTVLYLLVRLSKSRELAVLFYGSILDADLEVVPIIIISCAVPVLELMKVDVDLINGQVTLLSQVDVVHSITIVVFKVITIPETLSHLFDDELPPLLVREATAARSWLLFGLIARSTIKYHFQLWICVPEEL